MHQFKAVSLEFGRGHVSALRDGPPPVVVLFDAAAEASDGRLRVGCPGTQALDIVHIPSFVAGLIPGNVALDRIKAILFQVRGTCGDHRKHRGKRSGRVETETQDAEKVVRPRDPD